VIETGDASIEELDGCRGLLKLAGVSSISMVDQLNMSFKDQAVFVGFSSEDNVAVMNQETGKVLRDLSSLGSCRFQVFVADESRTMFRGTRMITDKDKLMSVDIVIYGSLDIRKSVGHLLSSARIYLQHPCHQDPNTEYDNPHFLNLADLLIASALPSPTSRSLTPLIDSEPPIITTVESSKDLIIGEALQTKLDKVFNSLMRYKTLRRLEADIKITTPLLQ
jgi:hypothetical protein